MKGQQHWHQKLMGATEDHAGDRSLMMLENCNGNEPLQPKKAVAV
jgi:hypothetical protein